MTNFEKIKNMDIDEVVNFLEDLCDCDFCVYDRYCLVDCRYGVEKWLEAESDG